MEEELSGLRPFLDADGRLTALPAKHKKKLEALWYLVEKVEAGRQYTESEINGLLDAWTLFHDSATLRRELFNKRLLNRTPDGGCYWKAETVPPLREFVEKPCLNRCCKTNPGCICVSRSALSTLSFEGFLSFVAASRNQRFFSSSR